ncbi:unnamed protein product, partial [Brachionus calyciflorus]
LSVTNSKYWLLSCNLSGCSFAFSTCMTCLGESGCKACISLSKPGCSTCADDIFKKDDLETIDGNKYLLCDPLDPIQSTVCHIYCRGQYAQIGQCVRENNSPICKCFSETGSFIPHSSMSTQTTKQTMTTTISKSTELPSNNSIIFNGLNIQISNRFHKIFPLPNGDFVRGGFSNFIEIWDTQKGEIKRNISSDYYHPFLFGLLSNDLLISAHYDNKTLLIWDLNVTNGEPLKRIIHTNDTNYIQCMTALRNDDLAIGYDGTGEILIRSSENGQIKKSLIGHDSVVYQIIELPNNDLISCSYDKSVKVWNVSNGNLIKTIPQSSPAYSITILQNGMLAVGLNDWTISIWNLEKADLVRNLKGHQNAICFNECLHVLENGDLFSASYDKTLKNWNPYDGKLKFSSNLHSSAILQLGVLSNGNLISSSDKEILIWN